MNTNELLYAVITAIIAAVVRFFEKKKLVSELTKEEKENGHE